MIAGLYQILSMICVVVKLIFSWLLLYPFVEILTTWKSRSNELKNHHCVINKNADKPSSILFENSNKTYLAFAILIEADVNHSIEVKQRKVNHEYLLWKWKFAKPILHIFISIFLRSISTLFEFVNYVLCILVYMDIVEFK